MSYTLRPYLPVAYLMAIQEKHVCNSVVAFRNGDTFLIHNRNASRNTKPFEFLFQLPNTLWSDEIDGCSEMQNRGSKREHDPLDQANVRRKAERRSLRWRKHGTQNTFRCFD